MRACVILLNWNGWADTIECLESVFRLACPDFRVVVCDNASGDGSVEKIKRWASGELVADTKNPELSRLVSPAIPKPIPCLVLNRSQADSGAGGEAPLVLIETGENLGFAGGNNVGLRYALQDRECRHFWLLNNDTVVDPEALTAMQRLMVERPDVGLCGSLNLDYYHPMKVQAQGGKTYRRWTARVRTPASVTVSELESHPAPMEYVNGASMMASREFLERVGLLDEDYFLYFEELDWAMRARGKFEMGYARESVVYHKEGASIGSAPDRNKRSLASDQFLARSRVLFTKRFFPWALPSVLMWTTFAACYRACRGEVSRARVMLAAMLEGLRRGKPRHPLHLRAQLSSQLYSQPQNSHLRNERANVNRDERE